MLGIQDKGSNCSIHNQASLPHQAPQPKYKCNFSFQVGNFHYSLPTYFLLQIIGHNLVTCLFLNQPLPREMILSWLWLFKILILRYFLSLLRLRAFLFPSPSPSHFGRKRWTVFGVDISIYLSHFKKKSMMITKEQFNVKKSTDSTTI